MRPNHRVVAGVLLASAALIFAAYTRLLWRFTVDDAYITLRYALHLATHRGLTYNPTDPPVEGYTSVLWMLLLSLAYPLRLDPVVFAKLLGLTAALASIGLAARWTYELADFLPRGSRLLPAAFVALALAAFAPTAVHAVSGMETALFTLLLVAFGCLAHRCAVRLTRSNALCLGIVALLLGLARPEGNLAAVIGIGTLAAISPRRARVLICAFWVYILPAAFYFAWRWHYFGHPFPLPFYVKVGQEGLLAGRGDVLGFIDFLWCHAGILALLGLSRLGRSMAPILTASGALLVFFLVPEHIMGYDWRYLAPVAPVVFVLAAQGLAAPQAGPTPALPGARGANPNGAAFVLLGICLLVPASLILAARHSFRDRRQYARGMAEVYLPLARYLQQAPRQQVPPVLAMGDAGACPYHSEWRTIDLFGLNEPHIALRDPQDAGQTAAQDYVMAQHPDVVILISRSPTTFIGRPFEAALYRRCLAAGMEAAPILQDREDRYLWVMTTRGTAMNQYLRRWSVRA